MHLNLTKKIALPFVCMLVVMAVMSFAMFLDQGYGLLEHYKSAK